MDNHNSARNTKYALANKSTRSLPDTGTERDVYPYVLRVVRRLQKSQSHDVHSSAIARRIADSLSGHCCKERDLRNHFEEVTQIARPMLTRQVGLT
jgi:hypothetical protein